MSAAAYFNLFLAFLVAALLSFVLTPPVKTLAGRIGAVDVPKDARRMHHVPIPRLGGLAIFLAFLLTTLLFCEITAELRGMLLGAVVIVILGIVDDIVALPAKPKFLVQIVAALFPVMSGVRVSVLTNFNFFSDNPYMSLGVLSIPLTIVWIVGMTNAVNFIDGLDGLAVGVSSIGTFSILAIAVLVSERDVAMIAAILWAFSPTTSTPPKSSWETPAPPFWALPWLFCPFRGCSRCTPSSASLSPSSFSACPFLTPPLPCCAASWPANPPWRPTGAICTIA